nr:uncharacterized protein LOC108069617 [Drosophila takahashii]
MKKLAGLVLLLAIGAQAAYPGVQQSLKVCGEREGVTLDVVTHNPFQQNVKCFYHCHFEMVKIIVNGKIEIPKIENAKPCLNIEHADKCERASMLRTCLKAHLDSWEWRQFAM